jgi:hypothetical protein
MTNTKSQAQPAPAPALQKPLLPSAPQLMPEFGGRKGPDPTRYGDWENKGKCVDF